MGLRAALQGLADDETIDSLANGLFAAPHMATWIKDTEFRYRFVTPAWEHYSGYTQSSVLGKRDDEFRPVLMVESFQDVDRRILATGMPITRIDTVDSPEGVLTYTTTKFALRDRSGRIFAVAGVSSETTGLGHLRGVARANIELLEAIVESMPEAVIRVTPDLKITYANPAFEAHYGLRGRMLVGARLDSVISGQLYVRLSQAIGNLTPRHRDASFDKLMIDAEGAPQWRQWRLSATLGTDGAIREIQAVGRDVTDDRRYQTALEQLISTAHAATGSLAETVSRVLAIGADFFGLDSALIVRRQGQGGGTIVEHFHHRLRSPFVRYGLHRLGGIVAELPVTRDGRAAEIDLPDGDFDIVRSFFCEPLAVPGSDFGRLVFIGSQIRARPFGINDRMLLRLMAHWLIFAMQRHAQLQALNISRAELSLILESVPARITYMDREGAVLAANAAARIGSRSPESGDNDRATLEEGRARIGHIERWKDFEGTQLWMRTDRIPFKDPESEEERLLVVSTDVTELVEKEQALAKANEGLNQFAYIASHDLQEPLRKIGTFTDVLVEGLEKGNSDDIAYAVRVIKDSARRASHLISDLLSWSRLTNRALERRPIPFDDAVRDVLADVLATRAGEKVELIDEMEPLMIWADPFHVRQLIENLLVNAVKYRHRDRAPVIRLSLRQPEPGGDAVFEVADNGIGFDPTYAALIFEPFRRLHSERQYSGTGVGLAICARVCERHGWAISASGVPDAGATFTVLLGPPVFEEVPAARGRPGTAGG